MGLTITLAEDLEKQLRGIAVDRGESVESLVVSAVRRYISQTSAEEEATESVAESRHFHRQIKEQMRQRNPALGKRLSHPQVTELMDRLSEKAAKGLPFNTWREAEAFMRDDTYYDFDRQQYLHN
jgi:hypothetical protein